MTGFDYSRSEATAQRLIKRFGRDVSLIIATDIGGDPWNAIQTTKAQTLKAVSMGYSNNEIDGTLILKTDIRLIISTEGADIAPTIDHKVNIDGVEHSIVSVMPLSPAGRVVYWKAQLRA